MRRRGYRPLGYLSDLRPCSGKEEPSKLRVHHPGWVTSIPANVGQFLTGADTLVALEFIHSEEATVECPRHCLPGDGHLLMGRNLGTGTNRMGGI